MDQSHTMILREWIRTKTIFFTLLLVARKKKKKNVKTILTNEIKCVAVILRKHRL